ncbi:MAG TPA: winged helix-turn-helix domain-containing protein [Burkholderiaceae bacterium]|nr:winged helix-turn-helix domain-containing protein [Burkholderiaceae bacterium]
MTSDSEMRQCRLDDIDIDLQRQRVERDGRDLEVTGLSFQLLRYLLAQGDRVVGFDELIEHVWAPAIVNEETVTQRIKLLRQALGDDSRRPRYIRSVRGQGYQLCVMPQWHPQAPARDASEVLEHAGSMPNAAANQRQRSRAAVALAMALMLVAIVAALAYWRAGESSTQTADAKRPAPEGNPLLERAAYYAGIGQRDDNERAIALYQQVVKDSPHDARALLGLSRAYSARVCLFNFPPEWAAQAEELASAVIRVQPDNGPAYAARGYAYDCRGGIDQALQGYERALQLDPADDKSRASAGYLYERKGRLAEALKANTGLHGDPARVRFLQLQLASNLDLLGYPQAAEARYRRSFDLYPDNVFSNIAWPRFLFRQGRLSEAQAALDEAMQRGTAHVDLFLLQAELALSRGDRQAAQAACREAVQLRPQASLPATLLGLADDSLDPAQARSRADALAADLAAGAGYPSDWLEVALLHQTAGEPAEALADVQRAIAGGYRDAAYLQVSPWFAELRRDPGYAAVIDALQRALVAERARVAPATIAKLTATP